MESERDPLVPKSSTSRSTETRPVVRVEHEGPADNFKAVILVFYLLGVATLLPWNFFSNAKIYFMFKLRNTTCSNSTHYADPDNETELQIMFESFLTVAAMVPNVLFMGLNALATQYVGVRVRILSAAFVMVVMFIVAIVYTRIDTDANQWNFFAITMVTIFLMNAASAVWQGAAFGQASGYPHQYTGAVMGGMGMGGTIAAIANIVAISWGDDPLESGFGYFMCALYVVLAAIISYLLLPLSKFYRYYERSRVVVVEKNIDDEQEYESSTAQSTSQGSYHSEDLHVSLQREPKEAARLSLWQVFLKTWVYAISVFVTFCITLSCYPAVNSAIISMTYVENSTGQSLWAEKYFMAVSCFLMFNTGDWLGRVLAPRYLWPRIEQRYLICIFCFLRVLFIPAFMLCNVQPRHNLPVVFHHDVWPIVFMVLFAVSNGYLGTLCMMYAPKLLQKPNTESAGAMMSFFLSSGLAFGALVSLGLVKLIKLV